MAGSESTVTNSNADGSELERLRDEVARLKSADQQMQVDKARLRAMMRRVQRAHGCAGLLFWDCTGDRMSWLADDEEVRFVLGLPPGPLPATDEDYLCFVHPDDRVHVEALYSCQEKNSFEHTYRLLLPDNSVRYIHEFGIAEDDPTAEVAHSGTMQNVTERVVAEQDRDRLIEELESRNSELEQFTYTVSHDLKAPLITVRGFLGLLEKDLADRDIDRINDDMNKIRAATEGMKNVLEDLLHLSRIGRIVNPEEETPLNEVIDDVLQLIGGLLNEREVSLFVPAGLPAVYGDRARLVELLQNLLENAAKFMGDQSAPRVEIGASSNGEEVVCYVSDNGIGVEERFHDRIFGLFQTLGAEGSGTGVGLALAKKIVDLHGGRLWVESTGHGSGARFCFSLPLPRPPLQLRAHG